MIHKTIFDIRDENGTHLYLNKQCVWSEIFNKYEIQMIVQSFKCTY